MELSIVLDRFDCYELCVQSPRHVAEFLRAAHGGEPIVLREDFCGTAAVSRRWALDGLRRRDDSRAIAIDIDDSTLARARAQAALAGVDGRVKLVRGDALAPPEPSAGDGADVVFVGNFSIGYVHERAALVAYLRDCLGRLSRGAAGWGGGMFACDTYGGAGAFRIGGVTRSHPGRGREVVQYHWRHETADPVTAMVENSISFRIQVDGEVVAELPDAFTYRWRLWSIAELREAVLEAGFACVEVYADVNVAPDQRPLPVTSREQLGEDWIVMVVGRAASSGGSGATGAPEG